MLGHHLGEGAQFQKTSRILGGGKNDSLTRKSVETKSEEVEYEGQVGGAAVQIHDNLNLTQRTRRFVPLKDLLKKNHQERVDDYLSQMEDATDINEIIHNTSLRNSNMSQGDSPAKSTRLPPALVPSP